MRRFFMAVALFVAVTLGATVPAQAATSPVSVQVLTTPRYVGNHTVTFKVKVVNRTNNWVAVGDFKSGTNALLMEPVWLRARSSVSGIVSAPCGKYSSYLLGFYRVNAYGKKLSGAAIGLVRIPRC